LAKLRIIKVLEGEGEGKTVQLSEQDVKRSPLLRRIIEEADRHFRRMEDRPGTWFSPPSIALADSDVEALEALGLKRWQLGMSNIICLCYNDCFYLVWVEGHSKYKGF
jgi:hypothetical protein